MYVLYVHYAIVTFVHRFDIFKREATSVDIFCPSVHMCQCAMAIYRLSDVLDGSTGKRQIGNGHFGN